MESVRVHYEESGARERVANALTAYLLRDCTGKVPVFVMVGSPLSTGDSLGPFIGWFLERKGFTGLVLGNLENPAHATNLCARLRDIEGLGPEAYVVGVDAAIGLKGYVSVNDFPLEPGAGHGKELPSVGAICIMGTVTEMPVLIYVTSLDMVVEMAEVIADGIIRAYRAWRLAGAGQVAAGKEST